MMIPFSTLGQVLHIGAGVRAALPERLEHRALQGGT